MNGQGMSCINHAPWLLLSAVVVADGFVVVIVVVVVVGVMVVRVVVVGVSVVVVATLHDAESSAAANTIRPVGIVATNEASAAASADDE